MSQVSPMATTAKLKCVASKGMFPYEAGVLINGLDQTYESLIDLDLVHADKEEIGDSGVPAWVEVGVIRIHGNKMLVELPRQVVSGGRRIWVSESEVHI